MMQSATELSQTFLGQLIEPGAAGYDEVRRVHNGLIDKRPAIIARCRGQADIADAVRFARAQGLEISVRGGGHNVAGRAVVDAGLMLDLSLMRSVHVSASARTAIVDGGALWKDFNRETQLHGLATTGGVVGSTGVAGLTLGGGLGWLMPKYGMALDNLIAVNMVLADGTLVRASQDDDADLFWAVRGGGGNFGVAASFEFRLHPVGPVVIGGLVAFPFDQARQVLRAWRDMTASASDDLMLIAALLTAPDGSGNKIVAIAACHCGATEEARRATDRLKELGTVVMDALGPIPYCALNGMLDAGFPAGGLHYWKSAFVPDLADAAIDMLVAAYETCPAPTSQILIENFQGAASRVPVHETAYALRDTGFNVLVLGHWPDRAQGEETISWCRKTFAAIEPYAGARRYLNYMGDDEAAGTQAAAAYGPNLPRLRELKKKYDPQNVFHLNLNIPAG